MRLNSYDDDAASTLPSQLDLLELLVDLADPRLQMTLRLVAEPVGKSKADQQLGAHCTLVCEGRGSAANHKGLATFVSIGLLPGYNITQMHTPPSPPMDGIEIVPLLPSAYGLPIKPDWSAAFDILRRHGRSATIDIRVSFAASDGLGSREPLSVAAGDDKGAHYLASVAGIPVVRPGALKLSVVLGGDAATDEVLAMVLARKIFGTSCEATPLHGRAVPAGVLGTPAEILRVWHAPYGRIQGRGIGRRGTRIHLSANSIPTKGSSLGFARKIGPRFDENTSVVSGWDDRMRHIYVVGKTGSGKTNLMKRIARQDIAAGKGVVVVSPHRDLIDHLIDTSGDRVDDIVLLDFGDRHYTPVVNPLAIDVSSDMDYARAAEQVIQIIVGMGYHEWAGPVFQDTVRTALQTARLVEVRGAKEPTITMAAELMRDPDLRRWAGDITRRHRQDMSNEWANFTNLRSSEMAEFTRWVTSKFSAFAVNGPLRTATTSPSVSSPLSMREIYSSGKVLLVHLPDTHMSDGAAEFLGKFVFDRVYDVARNTPADQRKDLLLHVDEFQRFVSADLETIVTEARKFRLGLTFAHQNLRQLNAFSKYEGSSTSRLAEAIFSNVGTLISMKTSGQDVETIARELGVSTGEVRGIEQFNALARCALDGLEQATCSLEVPEEVPAASRALRSRVRKRMIAEHYWASRTVLAHEVDAHVAQLRAKAMGTSRSARRQKSGSHRVNDTSTATGSFLDDFLEKRRAATAQASSSSDPEPTTASANGEDS